MHSHILALNGGPPVRSQHWPRFDKGDVNVDNRDAQAVSRVLQQGLLFRYDSRPLEETEVGQYEAAIRQHLGVRHALAVSSGSAALALSLMAIDVRDRQVLCSSFAFAADPSAVILAGGIPVLVESDADLHMDPADLERKITPRTKAILLVHQRGQAGDIQRILAIAHRHNLPVVEDTVAAFGARIEGRYLGTFGTLGAFSTQSDKSLNTGEGGFLVTENTQLFERAVLLSGAYESRVHKHCPWQISVQEQALPLFNFRMDEMRGALGRTQLEKLPVRLQALRDNYARITAFLAPYPEVRVRQSFTPEATLGHYLVFQLRGATPEQAQWVADALCAEGIDANCLGISGRPNIRSFWNWQFMFPAITRDGIRGLLPATTALLDRTIDIPLSPLLDPHDLSDLERALDKVLTAWMALCPTAPGSGLVAQPVAAIP